MKKFFVTVEGEQRSAKFTKEEYQRYQNICLTVWGGMPLDVTWAQGTPIFKSAEAKLYPEAQVVKR